MAELNPQSVAAATKDAEQVIHAISEAIERRQVDYITGISLGANMSRDASRACIRRYILDTPMDEIAAYKEAEQAELDALQKKKLEEEQSRDTEAAVREALENIGRAEDAAST